MYTHDYLIVKNFETKKNYTKKNEDENPLKDYVHKIWLKTKKKWELFC